MLLSEEDAVAKQGEACSSVHLACDPFGLGVDAFGGAVAVGKRERCVHGSELGGNVYGLESIFEEVRKRNLPRPETVDDRAALLGGQSPGVEEYQHT
ncbi:hypothetical protein ABZ570_25430 [Micromonospora sp. NPDC007271]|uniref:hypothetical protein n=1 Tax=Micromonospora sp. NPDC007271 TaxID=3154587 RepID=UPI0033E2CCF6